MEEEQALNNENLNNEENVSTSSSNSTLKDVASNVAGAVKDGRYKSRKNNTGNTDTSNNSDHKGNNSKVTGNPANKLKNNLKSRVANQALNKASNIHPALKAAVMLNNLRKNGILNKQKKKENDSSSSGDSVKDTSSENNVSTSSSNESGNEKSSSNPVTSLLGSNFKSNFSFLGRFPLKVKITLLLSSAFFFLFLSFFVIIIVINTFSGLFGLDDQFSTSSNSGGSSNYVQWAINIANDNSHGYSQCNRTGPDYDCSSLVWYSLLNSGYSASELGSYPFNTSNEGSILTSIGFKKYNYNSGELQKGDILVNADHTAIYIGDGQVVEASLSENGGICGEVGDQTGNEIRVTSNYGGFSSYYRKVER